MTVATRIGVGDLRLSEQAKRNVQQVMDSDRLSYGPFSREFERRFAAIHGREFAVFVSSGTDALRIGLAAMKERHGWPDHARIAIPAVTFVATLNVVLQNRMLPYLVDVDLEHYGMEPFEAPHNVVGVMPVNLFGHASPRRHYLPTITDSCETMFMPGCADGEVSCFSTYTAHLITTGVGGLATTDDPDLARIMRSLANHGRSGIYTGIDDKLGVKETMDARFHFEREGYSSRSTELEAAIGCAELDTWEANIARRRFNAQTLRDGLADLPLTLPSYATRDSAWMMFPILSPDRNRLVEHLERNGIETRPLLPLTTQPYVRELWKRLTWRDLDARFPNASRMNREGFYVGCHQYLAPSDIAYMVDSFRSFFGKSYTAP